MTYLLDTHFLIWSVTQTKNLSPRIVELLTSPDNRIVVSTISFWEISLKASLGKLELVGYIPEDFPNAALQIGFEIKDLSPTDTSTYHHLKGIHHRDPFDRMLIWQAINNDYTLISDDNQVKKYSLEGLKVVWYPLPEMASLATPT